MPLTCCLVSFLCICVLTTSCVFHGLKAYLWLSISYFFIFVMLGMEPRVSCMLHNIPNPCFILIQNLVKFLLSFKTQFKFPFNLEVLSASFLTTIPTQSNPAPGPLGYPLAVSFT